MANLPSDNRIEWNTRDSEEAKILRDTLDRLPEVNYIFGRFYMGDEDFKYEFEINGETLVKSIAVERLKES